MIIYRVHKRKNLFTSRTISTGLPMRSLTSNPEDPIVWDFQCKRNERGQIGIKSTKQ